jgi:uncharacterized alpha-E superfamily protein
MLSRDADACYWIGRYVERAEATARMVDVHYHAALESPLSPLRDGDTDSELSTLRWQSILAISGTEAAFHRRYENAADRDVLHYFAFDPDNSNAILTVWKKARENARCIREQIASEMWESLNMSYLRLREWDVDSVLAHSPHVFFQKVKDASYIFQGILNRTMLMSEARDWLDTGRFLERADQTARLLDVKYHDLLPPYQEREDATENGVPAAPITTAEPPTLSAYGVGGALDMHGWIAVLKSVSAFEMFRKIYQDGITPSHVVDFLVLNTRFPASVRHGIGRVEGCLRRISDNQHEEPSTEPERLLGRLRADLTYSQPEEIIRDGLHEFLEDVQTRCAAIGHAITRTYLS